MVQVVITLHELLKIRQPDSAMQVYNSSDKHLIYDSKSTFESIYVDYFAVHAVYAKFK